MTAAPASYDNPAPARRPSALMRVFSLSKRVAVKYIDDDGLTRGAAIAFYTATSIVPLLVIVVSIVGLVLGHDRAGTDIAAQIGALMGPETASMLDQALKKASSPASGILASLIGIATLLATASGTFGEMQAALNTIWKAKPKEGTVSRLVRARAASLGLVAVLGFLLLVSLVVSAALTALSDRVNVMLPMGAVLLSILNAVVSLALISLLFGAVFKVLPDVDIAWRDVVAGAIITGVLFTGGKALIGWYIGTSGVATAYGAAGGLMVLLLWIYYSAQVFLLGAEITYVYSREGGANQAGAAEAGGRPAQRPIVSVPPARG